MRNLVSLILAPAISSTAAADESGKFADIKIMEQMTLAMIGGTVDLQR